MNKKFLYYTILTFAFIVLFAIDVVILASLNLTSGFFIAFGAALVLSLFGIFVSYLKRHSFFNNIGKNLYYELYDAKVSTNDSTNEKEKNDNESDNKNTPFTETIKQSEEAPVDFHKETDWGEDIITETINEKNQIEEINKVQNAKGSKKGAIKLFLCGSKKIIVIFLILLLCVVFWGGSINKLKKQTFSGYLYPICENGLYGYIDSVGNVIIEPQYLWCTTFSNGCAMVVVDTIYHTVYDTLSYTVGASPTIEKQNRMLAKYGYIDKSGSFVIKPNLVTYIIIDDYDGDIVRNLKDCDKALVNNKFNNNLALYCDTMTWRFGYINLQGNRVIDAKYYYAKPFSEGLAVVYDDVAEPLYANGVCVNPSKVRCAYVDTLGRHITIFKYETLTNFLSGRGIGSYKKVNNEYLDNSDLKLETVSQSNFLIDKDGNEIKELDFNHVYYGFSRDGICVTMNQSLWLLRNQKSYSFIDIHGDFLEPLNDLSNKKIDSLENCDDLMEVIPNDIPLVNATYFGDGFAGITPDNEHWFVTDKYLIIHGYGEKSIYEKFNGFSNGLSAVKRNGRWGFINTKMKMQIPCRYDSCGRAYPYLEEVFSYDKQGNIIKRALINRRDSLVWESPINKLEVISNDYSVKKVRDWGKWFYDYDSPKKNLGLWGIFGLFAILFISFIFWLIRALV